MANRIFEERENMNEMKENRSSLISNTFDRESDSHKNQCRGFALNTPHELKFIKRCRSTYTLY